MCVCVENIDVETSWDASTRQIVEGGGRMPLRRVSGTKYESGKDETGSGSCIMTILLSVGSTARRLDRSNVIRTLVLVTDV